MAGLADAMRRHALLAVLVGIYLLAAIAVSVVTGQSFDWQGLVGATLFLAAFAPVFLTVRLVARVLWMAFVVRPASPLRWLGADIRRLLVDGRRLFDGFVVVALLIVFIAIFSQLKNAIPLLAPFAWDRTFAVWDAALHGGAQPYRWLLAVLGGNLAISVVNFLYHLWFFVVFFVVLSAAFSTNRRLRLAFFYAFFLSWAFGGSLLATLFSSAGPVYFDRLGLGDDFLPLMAHLRAAAETVPVLALQVQDRLWESYLAGGASYQGISAMPSMHVGSAVLVALYGFRVHVAAGVALSLFALAILVGSVILGWHYAIDGYAGALVAVACWAVARRMAGLAPAGDDRREAAIA